ncbi:hypothetical protein BDF19DRAFT_437263 [Syncephalis fuscata]|nr:hypothetical protein BDF19DRAFT_437263 [Syncephalis fuscata]
MGRNKRKTKKHLNVTATTSSSVENHSIDEAAILTASTMPIKHSLDAAMPMTSATLESSSNNETTISVTTTATTTTTTTTTTATTTELSTKGVKRSLEESGSHVSKKKQKKLRKLQKANNTNSTLSTTPEFVVNPNALKKGISVGDIRSLILWCLTDGVNPKWVFVKNKLNLQRLVVLMIPSLDTSILQHGYGLDSRPIPLEEVVREASARCELDPTLPKGMFAYLPQVKELFSHIYPTRGPADNVRMHSPLEALLQCPLTKNELAEWKQQAKQVANISFVGLQPEELLAPIDLLRKASYPMPSSITGDILADDWIETKPRPEQVKDEMENIPDPDIYAIDCEMVMTEMGSRLARVTLLNAKGETVIDELVKQTLPVTDYLTAFSGMTEEKLKNASWTLQQVQEQLCNWIYQDTILVGHSLENDLKALKMVHTRIIDTSLVYAHSMGFPYRHKLQWLASNYLLRNIQVAGVSVSGEPIGHDSAEDALACLDLVKLRLSKEFGLYHFKRSVSIFRRIQEQSPPRLSAAIDCESQRKMHSDVIANMIEKIRDHHFVYGKLSALENYHGGKNNKITIIIENSTNQQFDDIHLSTPSSPLEPNPELLAHMDTQIRRLVDNLPTGTGLILLSGHGDTREFHRLIAKRRRFRELNRITDSTDTSSSETITFSVKDDMALSNAIIKARMGISLFTTR